MPVRIAWILPLVWLPLTMFGQQQTPPAVEQALRARVTEFLQYHVEGNFRKAYDMVAEDTKEEYFNSGKAQLKGFKIDAVKFTDDFTKAAVTATMSKTVNVMGTELPMSMPSTTTWKIENGKWVWYNDIKPVWTTPVGQAAAPPASAGANADPALPKDDKAIAAAAQSILQQMGQQGGVDKKEITLAADKASEEKVVFHNSMPGSVQLELSAPEIPGFTAKLEQAIVRAAGDVAVVFRYEPSKDPAAGRRDPISVPLTVQPLNQTFLIRVNFAPPGPATPR